MPLMPKEYDPFEMHATESYSDDNGSRNTATVDNMDTVRCNLFKAKYINT